MTHACCLCTHCANCLAVSGSREDSHALHTPLRPEDTVVNQPVARGWVTVHSQATMHGSGYALSAVCLPTHTGGMNLLSERHMVSRASLQQV